MDVAGRLGNRAPVRIVVCGPAGAGKTCFVTAAATETFPEHVPPHVPPTLLPIDALPDRVPALLIDTSSRAEDRGALGAALATAHVVVLCYAVDCPRAVTLAVLRDEWLPELRRAGGAAPIILLGCKLDARAHNAPLAAPLAPELLAELPRLEASLECSAKTLVAVHEAVYAAHRAVLYPTAPLFDAAAQTLAPDAVAALRRIFAACDADADGVLSSSELNAFQTTCFGAPLALMELDDVRRVVGERLPTGVSVTPDGGDGLTLAGFLYLHALFIEHGRADTVWAVLRCFGYDATLRLNTAALGAAAACGGVLAVRTSDTPVELSERALTFVDARFARASAGTRGVLHTAQLEDLFATAPGGAPVATIELGWTVSTNWVAAFGPGGHGLSAHAFAALWALSASLKPRATLEHLIYLGYQGSPSSILWLGKRRSVERAKRRTGSRGRSTLQVFMFGPAGAGKSTLSDTLAHLCSVDSCPPTTHVPLPDAAFQLGRLETSYARSVAAASSCMPTCIAVQGRSGQYAAAAFEAAGQAAHGSGAPAPHIRPSRVTLVLHNVGESGTTEDVLPQGGLAAADMFLFVFDGRSRSSFAAAAEQLTSLAVRGALHAPALLVASHADMLPSSSSQDNQFRLPWDDGNVAAFCASLGLSLPVAVCANACDHASTAQLFARIIGEATAPVPVIPETRTAMKSRLRRRLVRRAVTYTACAAAVAGAGILVLRWSRKMAGNAKM